MVLKCHLPAAVDILRSPSHLIPCLLIWGLSNLLRRSALRRDKKKLYLEQSKRDRIRRHCLHSHAYHVLSYYIGICICQISFNRVLTGNTTWRRVYQPIIFIYLLVICFKRLPLSFRICSLIRLYCKWNLVWFSMIGCVPTRSWHPSTQYCNKIDWTDNLSNFCCINILIVAQNIGQQIKSLIRALGRKYCSDDLTWYLWLFAFQDR